MTSLARLHRLIYPILLAGCTLCGKLEATETLWEPADSVSVAATQATPHSPGRTFPRFKLSHAVLHRLLAGAPLEHQHSVTFSKAVISLPGPDGTFGRFRFVEAPIMEPQLAAKFPEIKTYLAQGIDDPLATARFDLTPHGFHAQVLSPSGAFYVEPYAEGNTNLHISYYKRDYQKHDDQFHCGASPELAAKANSASFSPAPGASSAAAPAGVSSPGNLRVYRLACAATGEYTRYFGGTVSEGLAAIVTAINRVDGIYESELGIRLVLVANNYKIIYTNSATDPYTDGSPSTLLWQNQSTLDSVIGSANYDIGHVFGTAGGGLSGIGVVGTGNKAYGETGIPSPVGDSFHVDYVAHEIGHQFGAHHTFNSANSGCSGGLFAPTAFEPGSGSTIMAYAGVCGSDNLQPHSDAYFHSASIEEIGTFVSSGPGASCGTITNTLNSPPILSAGGSYVIPRGTPFTLAANGSDPDGDALTYCWEEHDLGGACTLSTLDNGSNPLFRSLSPATNSSRTFPKLSALLAGVNSPGEVLPTTSRLLQFRATARDGRPGGGLTASADTLVSVCSNAGPFRFLGPVNTVLTTGAQTITWDIAGTTAAPINAGAVNILLSTNGGLSFPIVLASNVPNAGIKLVNLPAVPTSAGRIQIQAANNIFFCLSPANFSIVSNNTAAVAALPQPTARFQLSPDRRANLAWPALAGQTFRIQYKDSLDATPWLDLQPDVTAISNTCSFSIPTAEAPQRFFRVLLLE